MPTKSKVVVPGCGDSLLSEHTALMGHDVISFDFEEGVILKMKENKSAVDYQVDDMLKMSYKDQQFDVVLDKGSFDALCVDQETETQEKVTLYCKGVERILTHT
jgi:hypothetical protein